MTPISRRELLETVALATAGIALPFPLSALGRIAPRPDSGSDDLPPLADHARLAAWSATLRAEQRGGKRNARRMIGREAARVGELAIGTPYEAFTLEAYLRAGGDPSATEPLTLSLTRFDCVTLVESCLAIARAAAGERAPTWKRFAREMERMRYRHGVRRGYTSRLHYFSEWITDGAKRGLVREIASDLGGVKDERPLRFMSEHRASYPALANDDVYREIGEMEKRLDASPRFMIPTDRIATVSDGIQTGDVLAFATAIPGLDVSHAAFAYRDREGVLRVLHAPLSGGIVEITRTTLREYVANIRRSTGILLARPLAPAN